MEGLWNTLLFYPFLNILFLLYKIFGSNIGLAVIALTILVRILLGPALKKQVAMTKKMGMLKPRLEELKKKYGKNPEKLSQEQLKLYKEVGYNPLGCFATMLPQFIILFAIIQAIPALTSSNLTGLYPFVKDFVTGGAANFTVNTVFLGVDLSKSFNDIINACNCIPYDGIIKSLASFVLGPIRAASSIPYLVLALLVGVVQYYSTLLMQFFQGIDPFKKKEKADKNNPQPIAPDEMQAQMSKSMNLILPVLTTFIAIGYPAVLGLYWFTQSVVMMVQYVLMDRALSKEFFRKLFRRTGRSNVNEVKKELPVIIKDAELVKSPKKKNKKVKR